MGAESETGRQGRVFRRVAHETHSAGLGRLTAADESRVGNGVVGRTEGPSCDQAGILGHEPSPNRPLTPPAIPQRSEQAKSKMGQ